MNTLQVNGSNPKSNRTTATATRTKETEELIKNYSMMLLQHRNPLYWAVVNKLDTPNDMTDEERKFHSKYFGRENMYYTADTHKAASNGFWRDEYEDYALFMLEEEMKRTAEEFVLNNDTSLLKLLFSLAPRARSSC